MAAGCWAGTRTWGSASMWKRTMVRLRVGQQTLLAGAGGVGDSSSAAGSREGCSHLAGAWRPGLSLPCAWGDRPFPTVGVSGVQGRGSRSRGPLPRCHLSAPCVEPTLELLRESPCRPSPGAAAQVGRSPTGQGMRASGYTLRLDQRGLFESQPCSALARCPCRVLSFRAAVSSCRMGITPSFILGKSPLYGRRCGWRGQRWAGDWRV